MTCQVMFQHYRHPLNHDEDLHHHYHQQQQQHQQLRYQEAVPEEEQALIASNSRSKASRNGTAYGYNEAGLGLHGANDTLDSRNVYDNRFLRLTNSAKPATVTSGAIEAAKAVEASPTPPSVQSPRSVASSSAASPGLQQHHHHHNNNNNNNHSTHVKNSIMDIHPAYCPAVAQQPMATDMSITSVSAASPGSYNATITSSSLAQQQQQQQRIPTGHPSGEMNPFQQRHNPQHLHASPVSGDEQGRSSTGSASGSAPPPPAQNTSTKSVKALSLAKECDEGEGGEKSKNTCEDVEENQASSAQYLTANCLLVTYFRGDTSRVVDEHFAKALNAASDGMANKADDSVPLSQRNFPPSFWNSDYRYASTSSMQYPLHQQQQHPHVHPHHDLYSQHAAAAAAAAADPYHPHHHTHHAHPHHQAALFAATNDPWNYSSYAAAAAAAAHHHRSMQDMYQSAARLNPQYSSLFLHNSASRPQQQAQQPLQQSSSSGRKGADSWHVGGLGTDPSGGNPAAAAAAAAALDGYTSHSHYGAMAGLEGSMQGTSKDLYWF